MSPCFQPNVAETSEPSTTLHVATNIRLRRMVLGISRKQAALDLGLTVAELIQYEKGALAIRDDFLIRIGDYLHISSGSLFELADSSATVSKLLGARRSPKI